MVYKAIDVINFSHGEFMMLGSYIGFQALCSIQDALLPKELTEATTNLFRTHFGRAFIAIRDQDIAAEVMGASLFHYKVLAFAFSSFIVGLAGRLTALHNTAIGFERFTIEVSIEYLAMIIIGGLGTVSGSIYGAIFIIVLTEMLRIESQGIQKIWNNIKGYFRLWLFSY